MERKWWTLIVVCIATFMLLLDITIVNVALPKIAVDLKASFTEVQWVIDAYSLTLASVLLTTGTLADMFGRKRLFLIGLTMFVAMSALCALSPSALFLILARGGQGIGGAIMFTTSQALLGQEFRGAERGAAFGAWGATIAASAAVGPLLGGFLTEDFGWQWIFLINLPVGILAAAVGFAKLGESRNSQAGRVDWLGTVTFTAALFLLVFAIVRGNELGWGSTEIVALLIGAAILLGAFLVSQLVRPQPMFDLALFRKPTFAGASLSAFTVSAGMFAMFLYLALYLQTVLDFSPLQTGLRFLPFTVVSFFVAAVSGNLTNRVPIRALISAGLLLTGIGLLLMRGLSANTQWTDLLPGFIVAGAGVGLVNPALATTAIGVVAPERSGMASGINNTFRQVGIATGIAALGAVFESSITTRLQQAGTGPVGSAARIAHAVAAGGTSRVLSAVPANVRARAAASIHSAFAAAMNEILLLGAIIAVAGAALALVLVRHRDFVHYRAPDPAPAH